MNAILKTLRSKTMLVSYALIGLGFVEANFHIVGQFIPEAYRPLAISLIGVVMAGLRLVTNKPLSEK